MKSLAIILFVVISQVSIGQTRKSSPAIAEKVFNVPIFVYCYPTAEVEEVADLSANWSAISSAIGEDASVSDKIKEIVSSAKNKKKKGKIGAFDAIIINPDDYRGTAVKYSDEKSLEAQVKKIYGVPIYLFSSPKDEYEEVGELSATMSALLGGSSLSDRVKEMVNKAKKKEKKKKIKPFDAIIISPDDFTGILIKFK